MSDWKKIEAVLFASGSYVSVEELCEFTGISKKKIGKVIEDLINHYKEIDSSIDVFVEDNAYKLNVKSSFSDIVQEVVSGVEMPKPIMETLALIAYKSPVMQSEVINTRGTTCYDHISYLEEKKFISRERYGRTYKIKVTDKFNDYFDVDDSKIQSLFAEINMPEVTVEVPEVKEDNFDELILDRMKRDIPRESSEEVEEFLNKFEEKLGGVINRVDEAEKEIDVLKPKVDDEESLVDDAFDDSRV